jgi:hypothetical protein
MEDKAFVLKDSIFDAFASAAALLTGEFWAAIAGAVVGGIIAYIIQWSAMREAREDRAQERHLSNRALGFSLFYRLLSIDSNLDHIRNHVAQRIAIAEEVGITNMEAVLLPLANLPTAIEFSPDEMGMLLSLKDDDTFNAVLSLDKIHNSIIPVWDLYKQMRQSLQAELEITEFDPTVGKSGFKLTQGSQADIKRFELNQIANELVSRSTLDADESAKALELLGKLLNAKLGLTIGVTRKR